MVKGELQAIWIGVLVALALLAIMLYLLYRHGGNVTGFLQGLFGLAGG